jgi:hypothetical protein
MTGEKINLYTALDIFGEHIPEIEKATNENMQWKLSRLERPKPNMTASLFWVKANVYILMKDTIEKQYKSVLRAISLRRQPKTADQITQQHIEKAKEYPIENLLPDPPKRNMALCPLHNEKSPSFQIRKDNRFICWGCQQHGDSIDLYMKLNNADFINAVKALQ